MKQKIVTFLLFTLLMVILLIGCTQTTPQQPQQKQTPALPQETPLPSPVVETVVVPEKPTAEEAKPVAPAQQETSAQAQPSPPQYTIEIVDIGFNPAELKIKAGDSVVFVNKGKDKHWPASAVHPTHLIYPEKGGCIGSKFDACKGLAEDESFTFVFNHKGTWKYHDHLVPSSRGSIVVE